MNHTGTVPVNQIAAEASCFDHAISRTESNERGEDGEKPSEEWLGREHGSDDGQNRGGNTEIARRLAPLRMLLEQGLGRGNGMLNFFLLAFPGDRGDNRPGRTEGQEQSREERQVPTPDKNGQHRGSRSEKEERDGKVNHRRMKRIGQGNHSTFL